ncbi:MAG: hypothetical protein M1829_004040 [Trizodia sp. TS-e1964]|nr:MAG: hypothetical protein M1829_004040 [Trizodia sp. TS-e1964]
MSDSEGSVALQRIPSNHSTAVQALTLYEKKSLLINRELDSMGMGKYQWYIWALCGLGYMLDLLWAQALSLIASPMQQEFGFSDSEFGHVFTSFAAGLTAGAFIWGILVDIIGRRWAFNLTVLIASIFGLLMGSPSEYRIVVVLASFLGFGIGGNIPIDTTITLEFIPSNRRFLLAALSIFQPIGVVICSGIAYGFIPNYSCDSDLKSCNLLPENVLCCRRTDNLGWRYLLFTLGGISFTVFSLRFIVFHFEESPKFLLMKGRDEEAVEVIRRVAAFNGRHSTFTLDNVEHISSENSPTSSLEAMGRPMLGRRPSRGPRRASTISVSKKIKIELRRFKILFSSRTMTRLTLLIWITYMFDYWGFTIAGSFLPTILKRKNAALEVSLTRTYRNFIIIYSAGIPAVLLAALLVRTPHFGRKWSMVVTSALMATSLFLFSAVNTEASLVGINSLVYFFQSMFNSILYGWTPEVFPAPIRGSAAGIASFWGRLASIISPLIAAQLLATSTDGVLYLAGGGVFICTVATALLPSNAMGAESL